MHVPAASAACGKALPFGSFGVHAPSAHQAPIAHCASLAHGGPQVPRAGKHTSLPLQSALLLQRPQPPPARHSGASSSAQARVAAEPKSPLQLAHELVTVSHAGVAPPHAVVFVAEQRPQAPLARHAAASAEGHGSVASDP
jgi:hypothetical protein